MIFQMLTKVSLYQNQIKEILSQLGVSEDYGRAPELPMYFSCEDLVDAGRDVYDRELRLSKQTWDVWREMKSAAEWDGVELRVVSGFRSVQRQQEIILRKLAKGQSLFEILRVNAAPGYSQHHSGCALDLTDAGNYPDPLRESFEKHPAFTWLVENAGVYGFRLEYPRGNPYGFVYEPWHWVSSEVCNYIISKG